jgi:SAM-dependent methyltransferase
LSYDDVELSRLYDACNPWGPGDEFYAGLVRAAGDVLDVGCGTGRLLARVRAEGHPGRLVGIDPGAGMLAVARETDPDGDWVSGELGPGRYREEFDLVTMTGHAFQELRTDGQLGGVLSGMRDAVRPGGLVAFETRDPAARAWEDWHGSSFEVPYQGGTVRVSYEVHEVDGDLVTFDEITEGGPWVRDVARGTLRFLDRDRLAAFLAAAGLRVREQYGDWDRSPAGPEIITLAERSPAR